MLLIPVINRTLILLLPFQDPVPFELLLFLLEFAVAIITFCRLPLFAFFILEFKFLSLFMITFYRFLCGFSCLSVCTFHHFFLILNFLENHHVLIYDIHFFLHSFSLLNLRNFSFSNHMSYLYNLFLCRIYI